MDPTQDYFEDRAKDWVDDAYNESNGLMPIGLQRLSIVRSLLKDTAVKQGERACDLGCGEGALCRELNSLGFEATGVDRSETMVALAKENSTGQSIHFKQSAIEDIVSSVGENQFDLVTSMGVMYYLAEDKDFFQPLSKILKPGGRAIISCRNRLFNLFNGSRKAHKELDGIDIKPLLKELLNLDCRIGAEDMQHFLAHLHSLTAPETLDNLPKPNNLKQEELEKVIETVEGRQHLPSELTKSATAAGLSVRGFYGVQPHLLVASALDDRANQLLKKSSEALLSLNHLPVSLIWSSHFIVDLSLD